MHTRDFRPVDLLRPYQPPSRFQLERTSPYLQPQGVALLSEHQVAWLCFSWEPCSVSGIFSWRWGPIERDSPGQRGTLVHAVPDTVTEKDVLAFMRFELVLGHERSEPEGMVLLVSCVQAVGWWKLSTPERGRTKRWPVLLLSHLVKAARWLDADRVRVMSSEQSAQSCNMGLGELESGSYPSTVVSWYDGTPVRCGFSLPTCPSNPYDFADSWMFSSKGSASVVPRFWELKIAHKEDPCT